MNQDSHLLTSIDPIKVVLFDHDDTLVGTIKAKWAQHKFVAETFYGKKLTDEELQEHWGKPFTVLISKLYETDHIDMAMSYNIATRDQFPKQLLPDTLETLKSLRKKGKKLGLVTATTNSSLTHDFATLGISKEIFDYIQTEDDTDFHKPDPKVFERAKVWIQEHSFDSSEVLYVGDHLKDLQAARGAGFHFIGVETGLITKEEFEKHQAQSIKKLSDLLLLES